MNYYLYGLQRSGTNVIKTFLNKYYNISFNNTDNRNEISHKHFRIYDDKTKITICIQHQYMNNLIIDTYESLVNELNEDIENVKIFVIIKDIFSWLLSINEWGKKCKWTPFHRDSFLHEYKLYVNKWKELAVNKNICIIYYEEYIDFIKNKNSNNHLIHKINDFLNQNININISEISEIKKVDCSKLFTEEEINYYYYKKYLNTYTTNEIEIINKFLEI